MKLIVKFVFVMLISLNLLCRSIAMPQQQPRAQQAQQSSTGQAITSPSQAITAGTVNSGLDFTRNMVDWFSGFMNNIWKTIPNFVTMFIPNPASGVAAAAGGSAPALPGIPSLPSLSSKQSGEKDSSQAQDTEFLTSFPQIPQLNRMNKPLPSAPRKHPKNDIELINNEISTDDE